MCNMHQNVYLQYVYMHKLVIQRIAFPVDVFAIISYGHLLGVDLCFK